MPQISNKELVFVDGKFFERKSYIAVITAFRQRFNQAPPCKKNNPKNITKFSLHGSSLNRNRENSERRRTARSEENIELVRNILENHL